MKSDVKLYYVGNCDIQIEVEANIDGIEIRTAELGDDIKKSRPAYLDKDDVNELIEMLETAKAHYLANKEETK